MNTSKSLMIAAAAAISLGTVTAPAGANEKSACNYLKSEARTAIARSLLPHDDRIKILQVYRAGLGNCHFGNDVKATKARVVINGMLKNRK